MSKGTPHRSLRIPDDLVAEVEVTIQRRNEFSVNEPWSFTGFILAAVREKIDKMERSRRTRASVKKSKEALKQLRTVSDERWEEIAAAAHQGEPHGPADTLDREPFRAFAGPVDLIDVSEHDWEVFGAIDAQTIYKCRLCGKEVTYRDIEPYGCPRRLGK